MTVCMPSLTQIERQYQELRRQQRTIHSAHVFITKSNNVISLLRHYEDQNTSYREAMLTAFDWRERQNECGYHNGNVC